MPASFARAALCTVLAGIGLLSNTASGIAQTAPETTPSPTPTQTATVQATTTTTATLTATPEPSGTPAPAPSPAAAAAAPVFSSGVPCATDDPATPGHVRRSERRGQDENGEGNNDEFATGNGRNEVVVHNCTDRRLRVAASIQLNTIPGHVVAPFNEAYAESSCVDCQTLSVALQIDLYSPRANDVRPENYAFAINSNCSHCLTVARAVQYAQAVDDPHDVPEDVAGTVAELDRELRSIQTDPSISLADAEARLNAVLARFTALGGSLGEQRDERGD